MFRLQKKDENEHPRVYPSPQPSENRIEVRFQPPECSYSTEWKRSTKVQLTRGRIRRFYKKVVKEEQHKKESFYV
jgi:hypothetical protein